MTLEPFPKTQETVRIALKISQGAAFVKCLLIKYVHDV